MSIIVPLIVFSLSFTLLVSCSNRTQKRAANSEHFSCEKFRIVDGVHKPASHQQHLPDFFIISSEISYCENVQLDSLSSNTLSNALNSSNSNFSDNCSNSRNFSQASNNTENGERFNLESIKDLKLQSDHNFGIFLEDFPGPSGTENDEFVPVNQVEFPLDLPEFPLSSTALPLDSPTFPLDLPELLLSSPTFPLDSPTFPLDLPELPLDSPTFPLDLPELSFNSTAFPLDSPKLDELKTYNCLQKASVFATQKSLPSQQLNESLLSQFDINFHPENADETIRWEDAVISTETINAQTSYPERGSNSEIGRFETVLYNKYAEGIFNLLTKESNFSINELIQMRQESISVLISTISSLPFPLKPWYYLFKVNLSGSERKIYRKIPLYFLFTSILYLKRHEGSSISGSLKILIGFVYRRLLAANHFKSNKWAFLNDYLQELLKDCPSLETIPSSRKEKPIYDILTVSFIYNEMKFGASKHTKSFFRNVWEACKADFKSGEDRIQLNVNPVLNIPYSWMNKPRVFEAVAYRFYQLKFTEMIFKPRNSMDELLEEYEQLKSDFSSISIDFRSRIFNERDFESLKTTLENIKSLLFSHSFSNNSLVRDFFVELEYFVNFKSLLFAHDFCTEFNPKFIETFETLKSISNYLEEIRALLAAVFIELKQINLDSLSSWKVTHSFNLETLVKTFSPFQTSPGVQLAAKSDEIFHFFDNFHYFESTSSFLPKLIRLEYAELINALEIILGSSDKLIEEFFCRDNYQLGKKVCNASISDFAEFSPQDQKKFLERFKAFLILHNQ